MLESTKQGRSSGEHHCTRPPPECAWVILLLVAWLSGECPDSLTVGDLFSGFIGRNCDLSNPEACDHTIYSHGEGFYERELNLQFEAGLLWGFAVVHLCM